MSNRQLTIVGGSTTLTLVHPIGDVYPTTGEGMWLGADPQIFGPPPTVFDQQDRVNTAGSTITPQRHGPRDLVIPITVQVPDNPAKMEEVLANLTATVDALKTGTVRITYTRDDGTAARWIDAYHMSTAPIVYRHDGWPTASIRVAFRAPYPYWSSGADQTATVTTFADLTTADYGFSASARTFSDVWPFSSDDIVYESAAPVVTGDLPAYAVIEVDGPCDLFEFIHHQVDATTYPQWFRFDQPLAAGETLTINARPDARTVEVDGVTAWAAMQGPDRVPVLPVGTNKWWARVPGQTLATEVRVTWRPRWLTC